MAFLCDSPTVSHGSANETGGGGMQSFFRFKALLPEHVCCCGEGKKQQWINGHRAADNSVERALDGYVDRLFVLASLWSWWVGSVSIILYCFSI